MAFLITEAGSSISNHKVIEEVLGGPRRDIKLRSSSLDPKPNKLDLRPKRLMWIVCTIALATSPMRATVVGGCAEFTSETRVANHLLSENESLV